MNCRSINDALSHSEFPKSPRPRSDKQLVSGFLQDAEGILETAQAAASHSDFTILISPEGTIHMLADSDWPLASLAQHHGSRTLYRVSRNSGRVSVEGRSGNQTCRLETESCQSVARRLLAGPRA